MTKLTEHELDQRLAEWSEFYTDSQRAPLEEKQVSPTPGELLLIAVILVMGSAVAVVGVGTIAGYLWQQVVG